MTMYLISHDYSEGTPITLEKITAKAYDAHTDPEYADYLHFVILKAQRVVKNADDLQQVNFLLNDDGCITPFGESGHPYCNRFLTWQR